MKTLTHALALSALCSAALAQADSPRVELKNEPQYEETLSCLPVARPFFNRGWDALSNLRKDEARKLFSQAVAADPACTLAWAHLGALTPNGDGKRMLDDASASSARITEQEKLQVLALAAQHRGENEQALELVRSALIYDPRSYRLNLAVAQGAGMLEQWSEMASAAMRATQLEPERGAGWNQLGYAYLGLGKNAAAVEALQHYARVAPMEANAYDSLGDALLANGQLKEAGAAYQRALDNSSGSFWVAGTGVATVCALQVEWACARAALERARRSAPREVDRIEMTKWVAWSYLADGQAGEAYRALDEFEQGARALGQEAMVVDARLVRGRMLLTQRRFRDALQVFTVLGPQKFPTIESEPRRALEGRRLDGLIEAEVRLGNVAEAEKSFVKLQKLFEGRPRDTEGLDALAHSRGMISMQRRDLRTAISAFQRCSESYDTCRLHLAEAQELAGSVESAKKTRALVRMTNHRDPECWWARIQAGESEPRAKQEDRSAF